MANVNQLSQLFINDTDVALVTNSAISFSQGAKTVAAHITCTQNFTDESPVFDFFIQNQAATIKLVIQNTLDSGGPTERTIVFENAICKDYIETFDMQHQTQDDVNDLLIVFTIQADTVAMGGTNFPG